MLALIRSQQKWIMIVVATIIIIAFAWLYNRVDYGPQGRMGTEAAFTVYGRTYNTNEADRLIRSYDILQGLGLSQLAGLLRGNRVDNDLTDFAINLIVLREEARRLGIEPSRDRIAREIRALPVFNPQGAFDANIYQRFVTNFLTPQGFSQLDFEQLMADSISFEKLQDIFQANVIGSPLEVNEVFEDRFARFTAARLDLPKSDKIDPATITEDDIKKHYEENKERYNSEPKRRIAYVHFPKPTFDDDAATPGKKDDADTGADAAGDEKKDEEEKAKPEISPEERKKREREVYEKVDGLITAIADGATLTDAAKAQGVEIIRTEPFGARDIPEALGNAYRLQGEITKAQLGEISDAIPTTEGFYVFELLEIIEPTPRDLAEVKDEVRKALAEEKAAEATGEKADELEKSLAAALAKGTSISDAAKQLKLETKPLPPYSRDDPPRDAPDIFSILQASTGLKAGDVAKVAPPAGNPFLLYVEKREMPEAEKAAEDKANLATLLGEQDGFGLFANWFQARIRGAEPQKKISFTPSTPG